MTNMYVRHMVSAVETVCESAALNIAASLGQNIKGINNQYWWYEQHTSECDVPHSCVITNQCLS